MKKQKKTIISLLILALLIGLIILINSFVGNPISRIIVNHSAENYIKETYPEMDLEVDKATYNFKFGEYNVNVKSSTSIDTYFSLGVSQLGKVQRDNYEDDVMAKFNTWIRINMDYREMVAKVFESEDFIYQSDIDFGTLKLKEQSEQFGPSYGIDLDELELDKDYNIKKLGEDNGQVILYIEGDTDKEINAKRVAEILLDIKEVFDEKDIPFYAIDFSLVEPKDENSEDMGEVFQVREFLYNDIYKEDLIQRLEKASDKLEEHYEKEDAKVQD